MIRVVRPRSRIRILTFYPSRIQGSKRHRIPDPDPQHWLGKHCKAWTNTKLLTGNMYIVYIQRQTGSLQSTNLQKLYRIFWKKVGIQSSGSVRDIINISLFIFFRYVRMHNCPFPNFSFPLSFFYIFWNQWFCHQCASQPCSKLVLP